MSASDRAFIFDLDDTLCLERDYARSGFRAVAEAWRSRLGDPDRAADLMLAELDAGNRARVFDALLARLGQPAEREVVDGMVATYRDHVPVIALCADADRALTRLRGTARLGLVTDGWLRAQERKIDALGLRRRLDLVLLTDEWGREFWKPHPRAFEEVAARLRIPPGRCTYVADNPAKDFLAPNRLGWRTVQVCRAGALYVDLPPPPEGAAGTTLLSLDGLT